MLAAAILAIGIAFKDRLWALLFGGAFLAYGIYVGHQTSGTWVFPAIIFVIPFGVVGYVAISWYGWYSKRAMGRAAQGQPEPTPAQWAADPYGQHTYRCFDGIQWTEHVADPPTEAEQSSAAPTTTDIDPNVTRARSSVAPVFAEPAETSPTAGGCARCGAPSTLGVPVCARCGAPLPRAADAANGAFVEGETDG